MSDFLFVYGLLKSSFHSHIPELRISALHYVGKGSAPGSLYNVGRYPGALFDAKAPGVVHGEIYEINDQMDILERLDDFEGVHDENPEYRRVAVEVTMPRTQQTLTCWAYEYCRDAGSLPLIEDGRYEDDGSFDFSQI